MNLQGILYEEPSIWLFLLITIAMGGWAAWRTGIAVAKTWKPITILVPYMIMLGMAVRFIHFAMFHGTLFSLRYYLVDLVFISFFAYLGWRKERASQMARQYGFAFERTSLFGWKRKAGA
ncbi:hypothetical protein MCEMSEM23_02260 [Rhabdaerophilaceae bacterium]